VSIVNLEFSTDLYTGNRDIGAIQKCNGAHDHEPSNEQITLWEATAGLSFLIYIHLFSKVPRPKCSVTWIIHKSSAPEATHLVNWRFAPVVPAYTLLHARRSSVMIARKPPHAWK
jgi:hypothetical protein